MHHMDNFANWLDMSSELYWRSCESLEPLLIAQDLGPHGGPRKTYSCQKTFSQFLTLSNPLSMTTAS